MKDFRNLNVWQKSHLFVLDIYEVTTKFPKEEKFGLTSQIRRAGVSIPANIAEGCGRRSDAELSHFLQIAIGSASEIEYHLMLTRDLNLLNKSDYTRLESQVIEIKRMLASFIKRLNADR